MTLDTHWQQIKGHAETGGAPAVLTYLQGSAELLKSLDDSLRLPTAHLGWDF